jgi:HNH endonuclease
MPFSEEVRNKVLLWSDRHCCLCKKACGINIEVHHVVPQEQGGSDQIENAIPLCFECHGAVGHYNRSHPIGTKYKPDELKARREQVYEEFTRHLVPPIHYEISQALPSGDTRRLPDVGFVIANLGAVLPVRLRIVAEIFINGTSCGGPGGVQYSGQELWNLNPQSSVSGHFALPKNLTSEADKLEISVKVTIVDIYGREHHNLPVSWVYMPTQGGWYFEPCPVHS